MVLLRRRHALTVVDERVPVDVDVARPEVEDADDCDGEQSCEIRHVFARVADATRKVLFSTTIADALVAPKIAEVTRLLA